MKCKKCGSENVNVQALAIQKDKKHGCLYWLCGGWFIDAMLWFFLTIPRLLIAMFMPKKTKTIEKTVAICQSCGHKWNV